MEVAFSFCAMGVIMMSKPHTLHLRICPLTAYELDIFNLEFKSLKPSKINDLLMLKM